jgi:4-hydroxybenzoyl-CoA thioesterase
VIHREVLASYSFTRERSVRFSDCDPAGIVFYPQYFVMFNGLVEDWFNDALETNYASLLLVRRVGLPTVRLEVDFKSVSRLGDRLLLSLEVERLGTRSLSLALKCRAPGGELRVSVRQVIVTTSLITHAAIEIPSDVHAAIARVAGRSSGVGP